MLSSASKLVAYREFGTQVSKQKKLEMPNSLNSRSSVPSLPRKIEILPGSLDAELPESKEFSKVIRYGFELIIPNVKIIFKKLVKYLVHHSSL